MDSSTVTHTISQYFPHVPQFYLPELWHIAQYSMYTFLLCFDGSTSGDTLTGIYYNLHEGQCHTLCVCVNYYTNMPPYMILS